MKGLAFAALAGLVAMPMPASAQDYDHHAYDRDNGYHDNTYYNGEHHHHHRCDGGNGAVGTIAGGAGGALIGNAVGGGTLGTIAGGVGGALLGRHLDKEHTRDEHGC